MQFDWFSDNRTAASNNEYNPSENNSGLVRIHNQKLNKLLENNLNQQIKLNGKRPIQYLRNSILPPLVDSIEEEEIENE